jgi:hypothetical protein
MGMRIYNEKNSRVIINPGTPNEQHLVPTSFGIQIGYDRWPKSKHNRRWRRWKSRQDGRSARKGFPPKRYIFDGRPIKFRLLLSMTN